MTTQSNIDLNTCVPGQKVKLRDKTIATYNGKLEENQIYRHQIGDYSYTKRGTYQYGRISPKDVVEILPLKSPMNIDLNTCVPGQKVELRDGTIATYNGLRYGGEMYPHNVQGWSYTSNGKYWEDKRVSKFDVIEILPMESTSGIDLNTCVPGQKLERRDGICVEYVRKFENSTSDYPHVAGEETYTDDGYFCLNKTKDEWDIVKILPLKSPMPTRSNIDLNTCVPGQKVKLRCGTIAIYDGVIDESLTYMHQIGDFNYTRRGTYWEQPDRISPKDVVEIIPLEYDYKISEKEEEFTQPTPELTPLITDQIDVTNPDHVSIIPHEHGVIISIKKGLTDLSWRHYNS